MVSINVLLCVGERECVLGFPCRLPCKPPQKYSILPPFHVQEAEIDTELIRRTYPVARCSNVGQIEWKGIEVLKDLFCNKSYSTLRKLFIEHPWMMLPVSNIPRQTKFNIMILTRREGVCK